MSQFPVLQRPLSRQHRGDDRRRLSGANIRHGRRAGARANVGHGRTGALPLSNDVDLLSERRRGGVRVRCDERNVVHQFDTLDQRVPQSRSAPGLCSHRAGTDAVGRLLIGNKCDCAPTIGTDVAQRFADQHDMPLFETSAKADSQSEHVDAIFMTLVHKLRQHKSISLHNNPPSSAAPASDGTIKIDAGSAAAAASGGTSGYCC